MHLNVNSIQNKFEDLTILNRSLKAQILVISETKIDRSYPDSQFKLQGYNMFRKDGAKAKVGGGLLVYISTKILRDLEEVNDLHCLINFPTRVTANSQTLIDMMLTNNPDLFKNCGVYNPEISDHSMIYGEMTEKVKTQTKTTDFDNFNKDLIDAPWHVGEIFDDLDDAYDSMIGDIANEHAPMRKKRVCERDVCFMSKE